MSEVGKEIGGKLSVQNFGWDKPTIQKAVLADQANKVFLMRAVGVVSGLVPYKDKESGEVRYGCGGTFEVTSPQGETQQGTTLYLPAYIQRMVEGVMASEDVGGIRIAYDIYAQYNEKSATSYAFTAFDLLQEGSAGVDAVKEAVKDLPLPSAAAAPKLAAPKA